MLGEVNQVNSELLVVAFNVFAKFARSASRSPMVLISANLDGAERISVHLGSQSFLGDHAVDLVVVWNDRPEAHHSCPFRRLCPEAQSSTSFRRLSRSRMVSLRSRRRKSDLDFQFVGVRVLNVALVLDFDDGRVNRTTPLSRVVHVIGHSDRQLQATLGHVSSPFGASKADRRPGVTFETGCSSEHNLAIAIVPYDRLLLGRPAMLFRT